MNWIQFGRLIHSIYGRNGKLPDLDWIQSLGLLAVKLGQVHALRIDFLEREKCEHLARLYQLISPSDLHWRPSNLMRIPNADFLERTGSENLGARLWRLPPRSANTLHKHIRSEEFYFVLEGVGRMRVGDETLTVPRYGGVLVGPDQLRQVFNDTDAEVLWLIVGAPGELEFLQGSKSTQMDLSLIYPVDPKQLPKELAGVDWPPKG
jgi:mannose-6-phosphate isomerase-like protein (cupin superfamily)